MNICDATFVVTDTETTGLDPNKDGLLEIGAVATSLAQPNLGMFCTLVNPGIAIPPEASAVHGITAKDVADAPTPAEAIDRWRDFLARFDGDGASDDVPLAMHNAEFDSPFLTVVDGAAVCTMRLAMHLWPGAPNNKNGTLRYWRDLDPETFGIAPHRGLGDSLVTASLLIDELTSSEFEATGITTVAGLIEYAESLIVFERWPFGKYRDKPISAAPADYVAWCLRSMTDLSRDMRHTLTLRLQAA